MKAPRTFFGYRVTKAGGAPTEVRLPKVRDLKALFRNLPMGATPGTFDASGNFRPMAGRSA